jgi:hypothetical protein
MSGKGNSPHSPETQPEQTTRNSLSTFWGSTPVWGAIGVLIGAIAAQISLKLLFVAAWAVLFMEFIRAGFFRSPLFKLLGNAIVGLLLAFAFTQLWRVTPRSPESPTLDQQLDAFAQRFPWLKQPPQITTVQTSTRVPINPCAGKGFLSAYKNICDGQVGQWIIDEANKISDLAEASTKNAVSQNPSPDAVMFFFTNDFKMCCADDIKDLRTEVFRRLGPPAKDSEEASQWERLFPNVEMPWQRNTISPWNVKEYAPYLKHLGIKLKRRDVPRANPYSVDFSEIPTKPQSPLKLPGAAVAMADQFTDGTPLRPFASIVMVTPKTDITSGYIVVEFAAPYAAVSCDLSDSKLVSAYDRRLIDNVALVDYLEAHRPVAYAIEMAKTPITSERALHIEVHSNSPPRVVKATHFDE